MAAPLRDLLGIPSPPEEKGLAEGKLVLKVNYDMWMGIEAAENHEAALAQRALDQLRFEGWTEQEVQIVDEDPVFHQSVSSEYTRLEARMHEKGKLAGKITLHYGRPATRKANGKPVEFDEDDN